METRNLAELYEAPPMDWARVRAALDAGIDQGPGRHSFWLATINADGSPHVTVVGALWARDRFWFQTGQSSRKGRNVARDPRCALSISAERFDLSVNGTARLVTEPAVVTELAAQWSAHGWPATLDESGKAITAPYNAQSAGPPPWHVYEIEVATAHAVQTEEPYGATRWTF
ncbi:pyridoxamine 5'-phosphate oxidase family protein [Amycolatopsis sp.]|uniref:pyridoxamine 5'-phosphate oxidase family protein n=1 Tax=Amycolatopsis sp. TaxID=37632 RepID=UPI002CE0E5F9|nr:pyridoxamine 5'-phosphate oxidase family protein [Amycolatopsis sp.]HVV13673.1 pyridoxamine 5'-phosphate oxidase family protein [Amycolatopsis sp.]